jgi:putative hydrolase
MPCMSGFGPANEGGNPFEGIFGDLARILAGQNQGPLNWDVARQLVTLLANEGQPEPNVDPLERIRLEELVRLAEMHVNQRTSLDVVVRHIDAIGRVDWANRTLDEYRPILERLAEALSRHSDDAASTDVADPNDPAAGYAQIEQFMSPMLLGMQAGGTVGHLARRSLGQYDLPIPRKSTDTVLLIPANIQAFATDWSLPLDELSLYVAIEEVTRLAVMARPHVHARFTSLIGDYVSAFDPDSSGLRDRLGELDVTDPSQLPAAFSDPQALLGAMQTPQQQITAAHLNALVAVFVGYVDHVVNEIATSTISSAGAIGEAVKRRRVEESEGHRLAEKLLGLELGQPTFDRGNAFISGVLERSDGNDTSLARLWQNEGDLPTPADVDAPGLWLARIDLPND